MKQITAFRCAHCKKILQLRGAMLRHESRCLKNPANFRKCFSCKYLDKKEALIYSGYDSYISCEPVNIKKDFLYCSKLNMFLYTPVNEIKGNFTHVDDEGGVFDNNPMPLSCDEYVSSILIDFCE